MATILRGILPGILLRDETRTADKVKEAVIPKPQLRGLLRTQIRRNLFIGFTLSILSGLAVKVFVADVRKERYAEFHRTFDSDKAFETMRKKGLFQSC